MGKKARLEINLLENARNFKVMYGAGLCPACNVTDERDMPVPVFGPVQIAEPPGFAPYLVTWWVSDIQPGAAALDKLQRPLVGPTLALRKKTFPGPAVVMNDVWAGHSGQAFFFSDIEVPRDMRVEVRMGYDGPFRLWIDDEPFHTDMDGINPIIPDEVVKPFVLKKGKRRITVAMDINQGMAWGFMLRFKRADVSGKPTEKNDCPIPRPCPELAS